MMVLQFFNVLLTEFPQKPVNLNGFVRPAIFLFEVLPQSLHCYNSRSSNLYFIRTTMCNLLLGFNYSLEFFAIFKDTPVSESLWYTIVSEHGQLINIIELSRAFAAEVGPNVSNKYLCSLIKVDLVSFVDGVILEIRKIARKNV
jgi:hypothetical protein